MTTSIHTAPTPAPAQLEGWGMFNRARCQLVRARNAAEIAATFAEATRSGRTVALRGAGCSYGDAALNDGQLVLDLSAMSRVLGWDAASGRVVVEPGVTIAQLWRRTLPDGWWPAVVPGTSAVTVGGAAAANAHGKNNWRVGAFGDAILAFDLLLPTGEALTCSREERADLFHAAIGGLGLLGAFTSLTLQTRRVHSGLVEERQTAHGSLAALLAALDAATARATDLVAWVDTSARGDALGRGLLKAGRDLAPGDDPAPRRTLSEAGQLGRPGLAQRLPPGALPWLARPLTSPLGVWAANRGQWMRGQLPGASAPHRVSHVAANFPLDVIPGWRETYRPGGLLQHQSFVPPARAAEVFREALTRSQAAGLVPSFAILKKHRPAENLLSYLLDGYSLALDYPVHAATRERLVALLRELDDLLVDAGGRVYLAKDALLTQEQARRMYGAETLARFAALRAQCDPAGALDSDLARRVFGRRSR